MDRAEEVWPEPVSFRFDNTPLYDRTAMEAYAAEKVAEERAAIANLIAGPSAWLDRWAAHVGNCAGGHVCTCGLSLASMEAQMAHSRAMQAANQHHGGNDADT